MGISLSEDKGIKRNKGNTDKASKSTSQIQRKRSKFTLIALGILLFFLIVLVYFFVAERLDCGDSQLEDVNDRNEELVKDSKPSIFKDINPGIEGSNPRDFYLIGSVLYFSANDGETGYELWKSDGTFEGTVLFMNMNENRNSFPDNIISAGEDYFYFSTSYSSADRKESGTRLWRSDGTESGTEKVMDWDNKLETYVNNFNMVGDNLYFFGDSINERDFELWKSDGTETGTISLMNVYPDSCFSDDYPLLGIQNWLIVPFRSTLYFTSMNNDCTWELLKTDGTVEGIEKILDFKEAPKALFVSSDTLFFDTEDDLWKSDGTKSGTEIVKDIILVSKSSQSEGFVSINGELVFSVDNLIHGDELWKSYGTDFGNYFDRGIYLEDRDKVIFSHSFPSDFVAFKDAVYFIADDRIFGNELWKSDGTEAGTILVKDIYPGNKGSMFYYDSIIAGEKLYFVADDGIHGRELWESDGTEAGTKMVMDIFPGEEGSSPSYLIILGDTLFFDADDPTHGDELWFLKLSK